MICNYDVKKDVCNHSCLCQCIFVPRTKICTAMDIILERNSSFHVKSRTMGKVQFLFSKESFACIGKAFILVVTLSTGL